MVVDFEELFDLDGCLQQYLEEIIGKHVNRTISGRRV